MATNKKGYDPNKDYSKAIEEAKAAGKDTTQLEKERQAKINDKYGGKEPTMYGSDKTYSQLSSERDSGNKSSGDTISKAVSTGNKTSTSNSQYTNNISTNAADYNVSDGVNTKRNTALAGKSVKQGHYTVTYNADGYVVKSVKDNGASATHTVGTTHAYDSELHQMAYQAAAQGDWDKAYQYLNKIGETYGERDENGMWDMTAAKLYAQELQDEFKYDANKYYGGIYDSIYGAGAWDGGTGTGNPVYNDYSNALVDQNRINAALGVTGGSDPYAGTNYHQDAINAAQKGDWETVMQALGERENKTNATGENYGKTSADIFKELWEQYGTQTPVASGGSGFTYDDTSKPTYEDNGLYDRINEQLDSILNRDAFSYNMETDPLYKAYASMYQREGTRAMNDAMASAAAAAGGMNSYAMTAANQANNYYMAQLNDTIPELYQLAYEMYLQDIDGQVRDLGLLQQMDNTQYNRYRDTMSDWYTDKNFAYGKYRDDVGDLHWQKNYDQTEAQNAIKNNQWQQTFDFNTGQTQKEWDYNTGVQTENNAYAKAMDLLNSGAMPDAEMLKQAGMTYDQASTILAAVKAEMNGGYIGGTPSSGGGGDGNGTPAKDKPAADKPTGGSYNNGSLSTSQVKEMQKYYGVTADGLWGKNSQSASGGLSADAAWAAYQKSKGDPYAGTRNPATSQKPDSTKLSASAQAKLNSLRTMQGSIGSKEAIANSIVAYAVLGEITDAEARYMFQYFGYDPDEYLE